jgi:hypothetical protein
MLHATRYTLHATRYTLHATRYTPQHYNNYNNYNTSQTTLEELIACHLEATKLRGTPTYRTCEGNFSVVNSSATVAPSSLPTTAPSAATPETEACAAYEYTALASTRIVSANLAGVPPHSTSDYTSIEAFHAACESTCTPLANCVAYVYNSRQGVCNFKGTDELSTGPDSATVYLKSCRTDTGATTNSKSPTAGPTPSWDGDGVYVSHGAPLVPLDTDATNDVTLNFSAVKVTFYDGTSFYTRGYNGKLLGPLIKTQAGVTLKVKLVNDLGPDDDDDSTHAVNATNLHTHGLHVSSVAPADDVLDISVKPGTAYQYEYAIPDDHMGGFHWYHAHHHYNTALHAGGGAAGTIIIEDATNEVPPEV